MSDANIIRTAIEIVLVSLLIIGLCNEPKIIKFEEDCIDIIKAMKRNHIGPIKLIKLYRKEYHK